MGKEVTAVTQSPVNRWSIFDRAMSGIPIHLMEALDGLDYIRTGLSVLVIGMVVFVHAWYVFAVSVGSKTVPAVLGLVHETNRERPAWESQRRARCKSGAISGQSL